MQTDNTADTSPYCCQPARINQVQVSTHASHYLHDEVIHLSHTHSAVSENHNTRLDWLESAEQQRYAAGPISLVLAFGALVGDTQHNVADEKRSTA